MAAQHALDATFGALSDPTRRAILARLATGDHSVTELAEPFEISLPAVSRHLKVLENANLIVREKDAQWRRCHLQAQPLRDVADWVSQYQKFWEQQFDALADFLETLSEEDEENGDSTNSDKITNNKGDAGGEDE
jgi:DNA-binding transcriptional ArsR family regulator